MANEDDEAAPDDTLVELFLALLQRPQTIVRPVVEDVFKVFAAELTEDSVDTLIGVRSLASFPSRQHFIGAQMIAPDFLAESESEQDDVDEEAKANAKLNGATRVNGNAPDDGSDDSDEEISDMDGEDFVLDFGDGEVNAELKAKVEAALKEHKLAPDSDGEDGSDEEEPLDDEAMFALDEQLAAAFRSESKSTSRKGACDQRNFAGRLFSSSHS
jgi:DNA polymerase phi